MFLIIYYKFQTHSIIFQVGGHREFEISSLTSKYIHVLLTHIMRYTKTRVPSFTHNFKSLLILSSSLLSCFIFRYCHFCFLWILLSCLPKRILRFIKFIMSLILGQNTKLVSRSKLIYIFFYKTHI